MAYPVKPPLPLMLCFARSGGTLLNRMLAALPQTVVLSELNPMGSGEGKAGAGSPRTVWDQAKAWYGLKIKTRGYATSLVELSRLCQSHNQHLILRDWPYINFMPDPQNQYHPNYAFTSLTLAKHFTLQPFALVRNSIDVWLSMGQPDLTNFGPAYLRYCQSLVSLKCPIFSYEVLCVDPKKVLEPLLRYLSLPYSDDFRRFGQITNVNGDTQLSQDGKDVLYLPSRKFLSPLGIWRLTRCRSLQEANALFDYSTHYFSFGLLSFPAYLQAAMKSLKNWASTLHFREAK